MEPPQMKKIIVNGITFWQLDNRKRLFTATEIKNAEMRWDKSQNKKR